MVGGNGRRRVVETSYGSSHTHKIDDFAPRTTLRLDYIRIPLLFRLGVGSGTGGYVLVGPSIGFLVNAEVKSDEGGTEDVKDDYKNADVGIAVGAGVNIRRFFVQGTYIFGLTDTNKHSGDTTFDNRNSVITALVGVRF